jgi:hypothetical protein
VDPSERKAFLDGLAADFAALRADPVAWREFQAEVRLLDLTSGDGLEDEVGPW